jgi:hypothetical protein
MPTFLSDGRVVSLFIFYHIIARFRVPQAIVIDHGSHFRNKMMVELSAKLGFFHEHASQLLTLKNATMNTMLANGCQALLIIYINNKLVGGTPL